MDLFSRKVVGWSAQPTIQRDLVLDAVLMAVRRRREERFGDGIVPTVALSAPAWLETVGPA
jgi:transposase InsO family protein